MNKKKTLSILSSAMMAGLIMSAVSSTAYAKVTNAIITDKTGNIYDYDYEMLADSLAGDAVYYNNFINRVNDGGKVISYLDDKTGYVDSDKVSNAVIVEGKDFKTFTENATKDDLINIDNNKITKVSIKDGKIQENGINEKDEKTKLNEAKAAVLDAETIPLMASYDSAKVLVDALEDGSEKNVLLNRLEAVKLIIDTKDAKDEKIKLDKAIVAVEDAEKAQIKSFYDSAKVLVDALKDGSEKNVLLNRLEVVRVAIENDKLSQEEVLKKAQVAVEEAEATQLESSYKAAKALVDKLRNSAEKNILLNRLEVVSESINNDKLSQQEILKKAQEAVVDAETVPVLTTYNSAKTLVARLHNSTEKTILLNRLQVVKEKIDVIGKEIEDREEKLNKERLEKAKEAVANAETLPVPSTYNSAKTLVDELKDGMEKTTLLNRLEVVKEEIDKLNPPVKNHAPKVLNKFKNLNINSKTTISLLDANHDKTENDNVFTDEDDKDALTFTAEFKDTDKDKIEKIEVSGTDIIITPKSDIDGKTLTITITATDKAKAFVKTNIEVTVNTKDAK